MTVLCNHKNHTNIKYTLKTQFNTAVEVLHFDYNHNMLNANYEKALVLGCHSTWGNHIFGNL